MHRICTPPAGLSAGLPVGLLAGLLAVGAAVAGTSPAQTAPRDGPWWVFLEDRPATGRDAELAAARERLGERVLARRAKGTRRPLVGEHDRPLAATTRAAIEAAGARIRVESRWLNAFSVEADAAVRVALADLAGVRELRPVARGGHRPLPVAPVATPEAAPAGRIEYGPSYGQLEMIGVPAAHDLGLSGAGVRVLMLDTGYYKDHVALDTTRIVAEWDFINNDGQTQNEPQDAAGQHTHGTLTLSALGGWWPGSLVGPAYASEWLLAKTEDVTSETPVEEDYFVAALEWGEALGADIASSSLGYTDWYTHEDLDGLTAVCTIGVNTAVSLGLAVVTSAGNSRNNDWGRIGTPADAFEVISVGAVDAGQELASFSSPGPTWDQRIKPEVMAQGVSVVCAGVEGPGQLRTASGTSLSCPLVAGCAALLLEQHPDWGPLELRAALMATASQSATPDNDFGWGVIDLVAALAWTPPVPAAPQLQIELAGAAVRLSWTDSQAALYHVDWDASPYGTFATRLASVSTLEWIDTAALSRGGGFYRVTARQP
jgi:serine protease AprX